MCATTRGGNKRIAGKSVVRREEWCCASELEKCGQIRGLILEGCLLPPNPSLSTTLLGAGGTRVVFHVRLLIKTVPIGVWAASLRWFGLYCRMIKHAFMFVCSPHPPQSRPRRAMGLVVDGKVAQYQF